MGRNTEQSHPEDVYIQITTRCNMHCDHCCFSCGELDENNKPKGEHMTLETLRNALKIRGDGSSITIGGGEPTMHPRFWEMFGTIMENSARYGGDVYLVTNGKLAIRAIALSKLSGRGEDSFNAALSRTIYHDEIDPAVEFAFKHAGLEIRKEGGYSFSENGRARDTGTFSGDRTSLILGHPGRSDAQYSGSGCCCSSAKIEPDGTVRQCGCDGRWNATDTCDDIWEENPARGNVNNPESLAEFLEALNSEDEELASRMQGCWRDNVEPTEGDDDE